MKHFHILNRCVLYSVLLRTLPEQILKLRISRSFFIEWNFRWIVSLHAYKSGYPLTPLQEGSYRVETLAGLKKLFRTPHGHYTLNLIYIYISTHMYVFLSHSLLSLSLALALSLPLSPSLKGEPPSWNLGCCQGTNSVTIIRKPYDLPY